MVWAVAGGAGALSVHGSARATVAAIDPALTAGRGAALGFSEQEAENADTNGTVLPFDTTAYTLAAEASGRQAVKLTAPGQFVAFTLTQPANAVTIRYAIPDAPTGGGIDAPLTVSVDHNADGLGNAHPQTVTADVEVLLPLQPVSVLERPERRPAALRLVGYRVRVRAVGHDPDADVLDPVQADALLRRAACAARQDLPAGGSRPPDRPCRHQCCVDDHRPRRLPERR